MAEGTIVDGNEEFSDMLEQQTEIEALRGIYDQDMTVVKEDVEYKILIRVDSPSAHVVFNIAKPTAATQQYSSLVDHLPPVTLFIRYPTDYPSSAPPDFNLVSRWLDSLYLDVVAMKLHEMFVPGCTIVYDWVCFIQENLIKMYAFSQQKSIPSSPPEANPTISQPQDAGLTEKHPLQIFVRSSSIMTDVEEYNEFESHNAFLQSKHHCPLCFCEQLGTEFPEVKLECGHLFCTECILSHIKVQLQHGGVGKIGCPEFKCDKNLPDHVIRFLLSGEDIIRCRYERLLDEYNLDVIPGMVFCPRPKCNARVASDPQDQVAICNKCQYPFCKLCRQLWHGDNTVCPATIQEVNDTINGKEIERSQTIEKKSGVSLEKQHDLMAIAWVRSNNVRNCPSCGWVIQKFGGCNKMTCLKCHKYFCWLCGKIIAGYSHFHNDACMLFTNEDYLPPKEAEDVALPMVDLQELLEPACPRCTERQEKKTDNNLIACKKCSFKFCFRCREACYGQWHFNSEYGCPAYSKISQDIAYFKSLENTTDNNRMENTELK